MFIERVKQLLKEKNIYAKDMLADLEINKNQLSRWEKSDSIPSKAILLGIADYLGTTTAYLLGETDIKEKPLENEGLSELDMEIIKAFSQLPDELKEEALRYLDFLNQRSDATRKEQ